MLRSVPSRPEEREPADEARLLRILNDFAVDLIAIPSVEDLFWYVAQNVVGKLDFVDCVIYRANEDQTELTQVAAWGEKNPFGRSIISPLVIPFGRGITGTVAQTGTAIIVEDLLKDQNYIPDTHPARSEICVPLTFRGRVVGVIDSEHPDRCAFGEAELGVLNTVAAMTSAKLELLAEAERSHQRYRDLVVSHAQLTLETSNRKALEVKLFEARKLESIGRLTGRFAHEFNNLLTVISGNLDLLEDQGASAETQDIMGDVKSAAARGAQLIRDMLVFAQRTRLVPEKIDLNAHLAAFQAECQTRADVELHRADALWPIHIDRAALETAMLNLIRNARDAMPEGGVVRITTENLVHTGAKNIALATELAPGCYVRLGVADHGVGIPESRLHQIFDPFFTTKAVGAGTGLGLSMVLGFVQQSGGAVGVTSEVGKGTTIHLYLPLPEGVGNDLLTSNR